MKISLKGFVVWLTMVANIAFVFGIIPVLLYSWKIIPAMGLVVLAYKFLAMSSPFIVGLTLLRWIKKYPTPMTWFQSAYGVTAICTWGYSSIILMRIYKAEGISTDVIAAIIAAPIPVLTILAVYLSIRAYQKRFEF